MSDQTSNIESQDLNEDKAYFLTTDFKAPRYGKLEDVQNLSHGPSYQMNINGIECSIYTDRLNWFLRSEQVKVADIAVDYEDVIVDGTSYKESYKNGFREGTADFKKKYDLVKYGQILGMEKYLETLRTIKFEECKGPLWSPGLEGIRNSHLGKFNHKTIWEHGYYAGMYNQIEHLMNDYEPIRKALSDHPSYYTSKLSPSTPSANKTEKNVFNSMPLDEVRKWFTQLVESNSKNGNTFLTSENVDIFIDRAFGGELFAEKLSINEKIGDKANVIGLFHLFYTYCITHQSGRGKIDPNATAEKYIRLITDYFDNWTFEQVKNNFRSGGNWKRTP